MCPRIPLKLKVVSIMEEHSTLLKREALSDSTYPCPKPSCTRGSLQKWQSLMKSNVSKGVLSSSRVREESLCLSNISSKRSTALGAWFVCTLLLIPLCSHVWFEFCLCFHQHLGSWGWVAGALFSTGFCTVSAILN